MVFKRMWHAKLLIDDTWVLERCHLKRKAFAALLTDLSKAFDCLCHDMLIAKLRSYGLDMFSFQLLQDYLSNRKQRTQVDSFFSSWEDFYLKLYKALSWVLFFSVHLGVKYSWYWRQSALLAIQMTIPLLQSQIISKM